MIPCHDRSSWEWWVWPCDLGPSRNASKTIIDALGNVQLTIHMNHFITLFTRTSRRIRNWSLATRNQNGDRILLLLLLLLQLLRHWHPLRMISMKRILYFLYWVHVFVNICVKVLVRPFLKPDTIVVRWKRIWPILGCQDKWVYNQNAASKSKDTHPSYSPAVISPTRFRSVRNIARARNNLTIVAVTCCSHSFDLFLVHFHSEWSWAWS